MDTRPKDASQEGQGDPLEPPKPPGRETQGRGVLEGTTRWPCAEHRGAAARPPGTAPVPLPEGHRVPTQCPPGPPGSTAPSLPSPRPCWQGTEGAASVPHWPCAHRTHHTRAHTGHPRRGAPKAPALRTVMPSCLGGALGGSPGQRAEGAAFPRLALYSQASLPQRNFPESPDWIRISLQSSLCVGSDPA